MPGSSGHTHQARDPFGQTDAGRRRVLGPFGFRLTRSDLAAMVDRISAAIGALAQVKVGGEAAGHYHRPVLDYLWRLRGAGTQSRSCGRTAASGGRLNLLAYHRKSFRHCDFQRVIPLLWDAFTIYAMDRPGMG